MTEEMLALVTEAVKATAMVEAKGESSEALWGLTMGPEMGKSKALGKEPGSVWQKAVATDYWWVFELVEMMARWREQASARAWEKARAWASE